MVLIHDFADVLIVPIWWKTLRAAFYLALGRPGASLQSDPYGSRNILERLHFPKAFHIQRDTLSEGLHPPLVGGQIVVLLNSAVLLNANRFANRYTICSLIFRWLSEAIGSIA